MTAVYLYVCDGSTCGVRATPQEAHDRGWTAVDIVEEARDRTTTTRRHFCPADPCQADAAVALTKERARPFTARKAAL